jgi:hypothetical protein
VYGFGRLSALHERAVGSVHYFLRHLRVLQEELDGSESGDLVRRVTRFKRVVELEPPGPMRLMTR